MSQKVRGVEIRLGTRPLAQLTAKRRDITNMEETTRPHTTYFPIMSGCGNYWGFTLEEPKGDRKPSSCP